MHHLAIGNNLPAVIGSGCAGPAHDITCDYPLVWLPPATPIPFTFYTWYTTTPSLCSASNSATIDNPNPGSVQNPSGNDSVTVGHAIPNPRTLFDERVGAEIAIGANYGAVEHHDELPDGGTGPNGRAVCDMRQFIDPCRFAHRPDGGSAPVR